jgi:hypothetical protein
MATTATPPATIIHLVSLITYTFMPATISASRRRRGSASASSILLPSRGKARKGCPFPRLAVPPRKSALAGRPSEYEHNLRGKRKPIFLLSGLPSTKRFCGTVHPRRSQPLFPNPFPNRLPYADRCPLSEKYPRARNRVRESDRSPHAVVAYFL